MMKSNPIKSGTILIGFFLWVLGGPAWALPARVDGTENSANLVPIVAAASIVQTHHDRSPHPRNAIDSAEDQITRTTTNSPPELVEWVSVTRAIIDYRQKNKTEDSAKGCPARRMERIGHKLLRVQVIGLDDFVPPKNDREFVAYCREVKTIISEFNTFASKCLSTLANQISRVLMRSLMRTHRSICKSQKMRAEALQHYQCAQPEVAGPLHQCGHAAAYKAKWLATQEMGKFDPDYFIPAICCLTHQTVDCTLERSRDVCQGHVADVEETAQFMSDLFYDVAGETMEMFCGRYSSVSHCHNHLPDVMRHFDDVDRNITTGILKINARNVPAIPVPILQIFERRDFQEDP